MKSNEDQHLPTIGWREWLALPDIGLAAIKAKIDTGARSSALHAFDVEIFQADGREMVRFKIHPYQNDTGTTVESVAPLYDLRAVRCSQGQQTVRPVILTTVEILGQRQLIELTLTRRDSMGFRMLLGREAVRRRFVVDPSRSFLAGKLSRGKIGKRRKQSR